jgi:multidrug transporter EmrE-like cation transporter
LTQLLNLAAAMLYAVGAVCMKASQGFERWLPSVLVFATFGAGAALQTVAMRRQDIVVGYTVVLGFEAVSAFVLGVVFFREPVTATRLAAVGLVAAGVYLLRR